MRDDWERVRTDVYYISLPSYISFPLEIHCFLQRRYHPIC